MNALEFKKIRIDCLKWSQSQLALKLGMARNSISRMELGVMDIELRTELALKWLVHEFSTEGHQTKECQGDIDDFKESEFDFCRPKKSESFDGVAADTSLFDRASFDKIIQNSSHQKPQKSDDKRAKNRASRKKKQKQRKRK